MKGSKRTKSWDFIELTEQADDESVLAYQEFFCFKNICQSTDFVLRFPCGYNLVSDNVGRAADSHPPSCF